MNNLQIFNKEKKNSLKKKTQIRNENLKWKNPITYILTKHMKLLWALLVNFVYAIEFDISFLFEYFSFALTFLVHICGFIIIISPVLFWSQD